MNKLRISKEAYADLESIEEYTAKTWGDTQADIYLNRLSKRFYWLAENYPLGKTRDEIYDGLYSYPEGSHIIFYQARDGVVNIARVLHHKMDITQQLQETSIRA